VSHACPVTALKEQKTHATTAARGRFRRSLEQRLWAKAAIERFLRPVALQGAPNWMLARNGCPIWWRSIPFGLALKRAPAGRPAPRPNPRSRT